MKIKTSFKCGFIAAFFALCISCSLSSPTAEIVILSTNDMHGNIKDFGKLAAYIEKTKKENPNTYVVFAGDAFSGNVAVDQHPMKGHPIIRLMNEVGFNLATIGNHEFDYGQDTFSKRRRESHFEYICANVRNEKSPLPMFEPYKIVNIAGVKIAFLSFIQINPTSQQPDAASHNLYNLKFEDALKLAPKYKYLKKESNVFIGLTHLGYETDSLLALEIPELDLIIGGHSHTRLDTGIWVNHTLITQTGAKMQAFGETRIKIENGKVVSIKNHLIDLDSLTDSNKGIDSIVHTYLDNPYFDIILGKVGSNFNSTAELGYLMTDALVDQAHVQIAFINPGGVRMKELPVGNFSIRTLYTLDPFGNVLYTYNLNPAEIRGLLKYAYEKADDGKTALLPSGLNYKIFINNTGTVDSVAIYLPSQQPLDENKDYLVGMNSYMATKYQFISRDKGQATTLISTDLLRTYIEKKKTIIPDAKIRQEVIVKK